MPTIRLLERGPPTATVDVGNAIGALRGQVQQTGQSAAGLGEEVSREAFDIGNQILRERSSLDVAKAKRRFNEVLTERTQDAMDAKDLTGEQLHERLNQAVEDAKTAASVDLSTGLAQRMWEQDSQDMIGAARVRALGTVHERKISENIADSSEWMNDEIRRAAMDTSRKSLEGARGLIENRVNEMVAHNHLSPAAGQALRSEQMEKLAEAAATSDIANSPDSARGRLSDATYYGFRDDKVRLAYLDKAQQEIERQKADFQRKNYYKLYDAATNLPDSTMAPVVKKDIQQQLDNGSIEPGQAFQARNILAGRVEDLKKNEDAADFATGALSGQYRVDPGNSKQTGQIADYLRNAENSPEFQQLTPDQKQVQRLSWVQHLQYIPGAYEAALNSGAVGSGGALVQSAKFYGQVEKIVPPAELDKLPESTRQILSFVNQRVVAFGPQAADQAKADALLIYGKENQDLQRSLTSAFHGSANRPGPAARVPKYTKDLFGDQATPETNAEYYSRFERNFRANGGDRDAAKKMTDAQMISSYGTWNGHLMRAAPSASYPKFPPGAAQADLGKFLGTLGPDAPPVGATEPYPIPGTEGPGSTRYYLRLRTGDFEGVLYGSDGKPVEWWPGMLDKAVK